jgi:hypothetical protein
MKSFSTEIKLPSRYSSYSETHWAAANSQYNIMDTNDPRIY